MPGHTLFLTGHLAEKRLRQVLSALDDLDFSWAVHDIGVQVAALMTADLIRRRLPADALGAARVIVPGHCRGDLAALGGAMGVAFERGPIDLHDLPHYLGRAGQSVDLGEHAVRIFAEIVDAPTLAVDAILDKAKRFAADGADVIDLGCLPATPFPQMEDAIAALHKAGLSVSVDSSDAEELRRGGRAGADFLLSLSEETAALAEETAATPVIIPATPGDLDSMTRLAERLARRGRPFILDSVLDPIPFGFTASILRYAELRRRLPEARILMGIGNVTELTDADTTGLNALLFGIIAELGITDVLAVQVSPHCRRAIAEADRARRLMHAATRLERLPVGIDAGLMALRDRRPVTSTPAEIAETAAQIRDANFRIEVASDGIHVYNRAQHRIEAGAFDFFTGLGVESDGAHAFYLGVELARAEIAFQLGKRYVQDEPLQWGSAVDAAPRPAHRPPGPTVPARAKRRRDAP
jgi:dihydropteroate synthase-like protein